MMRLYVIRAVYWVMCITEFAVSFAYIIIISPFLHQNTLQNLFSTRFSVFVVVVVDHSQFVGISVINRVALLLHH